MLVERCVHPALAQSAYLIACQRAGVAAVVDPNRSVEAYLAAAARAGVRIAAVAETHIHADFVSGARELARRAGARLYVSGAGPREWQYGGLDGLDAVRLAGGERIAVGGAELLALHTPGHTPEHMAFLVTDAGAGADQPVAMLSGDFLFVGDVGRPDLLERAAGEAGTMERSARALYASVAATAGLPDFLQIWPGHGAGSACGRALGAIPQTTLGYERRFGWAFRAADEDSFVAAALEGLAPPPRSFARVKRVNRDGPADLPAGAPPRVGPGELARALGAGALLVDTRDSDSYAAGHVSGSLNLPDGPMLVTWGAWLVDGARPLLIVAPEGRAAAVRAELALIGADRALGFVAPEDLDVWRRAGRPWGSFERRSAADLRGLVASGAAVVDVRRPAEHAAGHIPGSVSMPLADLQGALAAGAAAPRGPVVVHCQGGGRSPVAAGLLAAAGWGPIYEMRDGLMAWGGPLAV